MGNIGVIKVSSKKFSGPIRRNPEWEKRAKESLANLAKHKYAVTRVPRDKEEQWTKK